MQRTSGLLLAALLLHTSGTTLLAQGQPPAPPTSPPRVLLELGGELLRGSTIPPHLQDRLHVNPLRLTSDGVVLGLSAGEAFDPSNPRWPPFFSGTFRFSGVYMGQGFLLVNLPDGSPRAVGRLEPHGQGFRPVLFETLRIRLDADGAHLQVWSRDPAGSAPSPSS